MKYKILKHSQNKNKNRKHSLHHSNGLLECTFKINHVI